MLQSNFYAALEIQVRQLSIAGFGLFANVDGYARTFCIAASARADPGNSTIFYAAEAARSSR